MRGSEHSRLPDLSLGTRARRQELQSFPAPRVRSDLEFNERHLRSFARRVAELRCFAAKNFRTVEMTVNNLGALARVRGIVYAACVIEWLMPFAATGRAFPSRLW